MKPNQSYKICMCCGTVYDGLTMKMEHLSLSEMPADIAIHVLSVRHGVNVRQGKFKRYRKRKKSYNEL
jgi:hypothetical protein